MTSFLRAVPTRSGRRLRAAPALVAPPLFLLTGGLLSAADREFLAAWGWDVADHHGVPWPSSLALLPGGWLQTVAFADTGTALIALSTAVPEGGRSLGLGVCGAGLVAAAFRLDAPVGDPASLRSWVRSWPAAVHACGFVVSGVAGVFAVAASRRRADLALAAGLGGAAAFGGTLGWYAFLASFFSWVTALAGRTLTAGSHDSPSTALRS
jgi:hypothetical protein